MRLLALDLGSVTGWAYANTEPRDGSDAMRFIGSVRMGRPGDHASIYAAMADWLADMITTHEPDGVLYEAALPGGQHSGQAAAEIALGLSAVVQLVCYRREVRFKRAIISSVRKDVLGRGNATKDDAIAFSRRFGREPSTNDAADADVLLEYGLRNWK